MQNDNSTIASILPRWKLICGWLFSFAGSFPRWLRLSIQEKRQMGKRESVFQKTLSEVFPQQGVPTIPGSSATLRGTILGVNLPGASTSSSCALMISSMGFNAQG